MRGRFARILIGVGGVLCLLAAWQATVLLVPDVSYSLPQPLAVARCLLGFATSLAFLSDLAATLARWSAGFLLSVAIGTPVGMVIGLSPGIRLASRFVIDFFRSLPVTAAFPIFLLFFGVGSAAMVVMVFFSCVFIIIIHAASGVQSTPPARSMMAKSFGASPLQVFVFIRLFEAAWHVVIGVRTVISISLIVAIVSEMFIGSDQGIGQRIYLSYQTQALDQLYASIVVVGLLGYLGNEIVSLLEKRLRF